MQFEELKKELQGLMFDALRLDCDNQFEAVILKEELKKLTSRLERFLGAPAWPSENRLSLQAREIIDGYGGIASGQTLYYHDREGDTVFAMLWPWKDGERTTVKVIKKI